MNATHTIAPENTACEFTYQGVHGCESSQDAVHVVQGKALCAYHSPYDVKRGVSLVKEYGLPYPYAGTDLSNDIVRQYPCHTGGLLDNDLITFASFLRILTAN
jgi:hypothetical protein